MQKIIVLCFIDSVFCEIGNVFLQSRSLKRVVCRSYNSKPVSNFKGGIITV